MAILLKVSFANVSFENLRVKGLCRMKKPILLLLCLLLCILPFSGCSSASAEKSLEDRIAFSLEQFGKPLSEAYKDMGLPNDPADALTAHYLIAEDSAEILGRSFATYIVHWGDREGQDRLSLETNCVGYTAELNGDFDFAFRLRDELIKVYGAPKAPELDERTLDLAQASADDITALPQDGAAYSIWTYEDNEIILRVSSEGTLSLEIQLPYVREFLPVS